MNKYELMYIIDTSLEEAPRKELIEKVSGQIAENGGEVEKVDEWGKRRLAYAIDYKTEGYYVLVNFSAKPEVPQEIERLLQINEQVLRYLVIAWKKSTPASSRAPSPCAPQRRRKPLRPPRRLPPAEAVEAPDAQETAEG